MKALVTGATGFLGGALIRRLKSMQSDVTGMGRNPDALQKLMASTIPVVQADLSNAEAVAVACKGQEIVFHCGALSSPWGSRGDFYNANVIGTQNIINGCLAGGVKRLVYVSTPSIYFRFNSRLNVREGDPLPSRPANAYAWSKLLAEEQIDLAYTRGLPVITIRPRAIFGPGDTTILPRLIERLSQNRLPIIGDGDTLTDLTYIENVVDALLLCAESPASTLGKKFNITNGMPVRLWDMVRQLCQALGYIYPQRQLPYQLADTAAFLMECLYQILPGRPEPPLTRYTVSVLAKSSTLDISAARSALGYQPRISNETGFQNFVDWWKETHT